MTNPLPIVNSATATFECIYGRGCDGICCQEGEPPVEPEEVAIINAALPRVLPLLRPEARESIEANGFLGELHENGLPKLRVNEGWCVFFNRGCVLHKLGASEGESYRYKPSICALFPLDKNDQGEWYVRQRGYQGEQWDLFCLDPNHSAKRAADTLHAEIEIARKIEQGAA
jgi:Fe-S-cluster containining protein